MNQIETNEDSSMGKQHEYTRTLLILRDDQREALKSDDMAMSEIVRNLLDDYLESPSKFKKKWLKREINKL